MFTAVPGRWNSCSSASAIDGRAVSGAIRGAWRCSSATSSTAARRFAKRCMWCATWSRRSRPCASWATTSSAPWAGPRRRRPAAAGCSCVSTQRHAILLRETHSQFAAHPEEWRAFLDWFQDLPLFVDAGAFRLVHACWDADVIAMLRDRFPDGRVDRAFVRAAGEPDSFAAQAFNRLLRGLDMRLPEGVVLTSREGFPRTFFRTKFWEENPRTYGDIVFQPEPLPEHVASTPDRKST